MGAGPASRGFDTARLRGDHRRIDEPGPDLPAAVAQRLRGYADVEAVSRQERRALTEDDDARIADELLQLIVGWPRGGRP